MLDGEPCLAELRQEAQCSGCKGKLANTKMGKMHLKNLQKVDFFLKVGNVHCHNLQ